MGLYLPYPVPAPVKAAIDRLNTVELIEFMMLADIPTDDLPDSDMYDWCRQRIFDWMYGARDAD